MDEQCNLRLQRIEMQIEAHDSRLSSQDILIEAQGTSLSSISRTLFQIKWILVGAASVVLLDHLGFINTLKAIIL